MVFSLNLQYNLILIWRMTCFYFNTFFKNSSLCRYRIWLPGWLSASCMCLTQKISPTQQHQATPWAFSYARSISLMKTPHCHRAVPLLSDQSRTANLTSRDGHLMLWVIAWPTNPSIIMVPMRKSRAEISDHRGQDWWHGIICMWWKRFWANLFV